jgi:hypothetical protein
MDTPGANTSNLTLEGTISLEAGVDFRSCELSGSHPARIGGVEVEVLLPGAPSSRVDVPVVDGRLVGPLLSHQELSERFAGCEWGWYQPSVSRVSHVLIRSRATSRNEALAQGERLCDAAGAWRHGLLDWLQALSGRAYGHRVRHERFREGVQTEVWAAPVAGAPFSTVNGGGSEAGESVSYVAVRREDWLTALQQTSSGRELPLAWQLMVAAEQARVDRELRLSVMNAASALECQLASTVRALLRQRDLDLFGDWVTEKWTLGRWVDAARRLGLELPNTVQKQLVGLRNQVAHYGHTPSADEAERAACVARQALHILAPLVADDLRS